MRHVLLLLFATVALGRLSAEGNDGTTDAALAARLRQLESETQALQAEVQALRQDRLQPIRLPEVAQAQALTAQPAAMAAPSEPAAEKEQFFTLDELKGEMKKLVWTKGDFKIVPYGAVWGSALYATERAFPGPYVVFIPSADVEGEPDFVIDTRRTRLGLDITGPKVPLFCDAASAAKVEVDFHGFQAPFSVVAVAPNENRALLLLRHAYAELKTDDWRLLAGQTWDVISPLMPGTVSYAVGWDGGNIGYRRMQIRMERYLDFGPMLLVTPQGALCQNIVTDSRVTAEPESTSWPIVEGRLCFTLGDRSAAGRPITFGFSGHIGEQGFDFLALDPGGPADDMRFKTWSLNADLRVPISERFGMQTEFFTGENLGTFLGGVGQGVNLTARDEIRATGGWAEVWYDWSKRLHSHVGYGVDDPLNEDIAVGGRTYNQFIFGNIIIDVTQKLIFGFEVTSWKTLYQQRQPGESVTFEFSGQYGF
ncbi:MAG: hypothetical protein HUU20_23150 [Pirellulales bacterium]|nr:hypothetical protein [Pirellulales bacterium]